MNNAQFDRLFDAAFEAAELPGSENLTVDHRPSWERVRQRIHSRTRRRGLRSKLSKLAVVAASLLLGAAIFGSERAAKAIEPLYATIKEYPSGIIGFLFERSDDPETVKPKTERPPEFLSGLDFEKVNDNLIQTKVTQAQAAKLLSFAAPSFGFLPDGYSFDGAHLIFYDGREKADQVTYVFKNGQGLSFQVAMQKVKPGTALGTKAAIEGITVEQIQLGNAPGILTKSANGNLNLETIVRDLSINLSGTASSEEAIRTYENLFGETR